MIKRVGIKRAAEITGLSEWELRTGAKAGRYPHMRVGGERGRIIFDIELLEAHIQRMMKDSIKQESTPAYGHIRRVEG